MSSIWMTPALASMDPGRVVQGLIFYAILVVSLTFHEYGHAWSARRLGDRTAELLGRLTLNPIPHLHPIFTVLLPLYFIFYGQGAGVFFAAARPVPVDPRNLRHPVRDMMLTSIAGPAMNVVLALAFTAIYWFHLRVRGVDSEAFSSIVIIRAIALNLMLAIFNMIPIPPLDGHRVLGFFLPERIRNAFYSAGSIGFVVLLILMFNGGFSRILRPVFGVVDQVWKYLMPGQMTLFGTAI